MTTDPSRNDAPRLPLTVPRAQAMRLRSLGLAPDAPGAASLDGPSSVVAHHLAMQGQEFSSVQWAIAARSSHAGVDRRRVLDAFDAGEVVRTWPMRGTVHALAAADSRWLLDLCGPAVLRGSARRLARLDIDDSFVSTLVETTEAVLSGGRAASRDELVDAWTDAGLDLTPSQRRYHAVWYLCQIGLTLLGPTHDGDNLLVLADDHVPDADRRSPDEAIAELGRRYLAARAPASLDDLQQWTKLPRSRCRAALAAIGDDLVTVQIAGRDGPPLHALAEQLASATDLAFGENVPRALALATSSGESRSSRSSETVVRVGRVAQPALLNDW